ncbi:MAG: alpha-hydroxy-acid oxidizing protein, partial [Pseudomonadota bacterium]
MRIDRCHNIEDFRRLAKRRLPAPLFHYIDGGADDEFTLRNNTSAFDAYRLVPDSLADLSDMDLSTTVLGEKIDWPVILSPTGMSRLFHHDGERAAARAAANLGTMYTLSTMSTVSIEDIGSLGPAP